ncbi:NAD(P)H-hydrate dehydratase [Natronospirillum operosum]|uniref:Bifunctional NAD(P)H-hydrate repair enzyme n=1 Tax=Natronospirillum operosum TaxID=2759953 RepID=A0A4Z0WGI4_9GAMM|nr:NAD(P)H-hydrate dehydratase [Natronospirillum operosum]TGG93898.1 NAD(P)H-hydrate dehydratase [Natronospirillum operosum]
MHLYSGASVGAAEQQWAQASDQPTWILMQRAATAAQQVLAQHFPAELPVAVLCGSGNNGGDGLLLAANLHRARRPVTVWLKGEPRTGSDAELAHAEAKKAGVVITNDLTALPSPAVCVDALLGTGFQGEPRGAIADAIRWLRRQPVPRILAVDCPSGLNASTGAVGDPECVVRAGHTVTFIGAKLGLFTGQGPGLTGAVSLHSLQVSMDGQPMLAHLLNAEDLHWPRRSATTHKGAQGHVLVIGSGAGLWGAGMLAAEGALVTGAGLVTAHLNPACHSALLARAPEIMVRGDPVPHALQPRQTVVVGPGLGRDQAATMRWQTVCRLLTDAALPPQGMVVDADALWHLAARPFQRPEWVLTPHPGEAARLLDCKVADIEADRLQAAQNIQQRYDGVVVLKGAGTVIAHAGHCSVLPFASGAMATGGLGDVLSGVIGALLAQGLSASAAAESGAWLVTRAALQRAHRQPVVRATQVLDNLAETAWHLGFRAESRDSSALATRDASGRSIT